MSKFKFFSRFLKILLLLRRRKIIPDNEAQLYRLKLLDPDFNGVFLDYLTKTLYQNELNYKNFTYKICPESIMSSFVVAYLRKDHYLANEINKQIEALKSNGLQKRWRESYTNSRHSSSRTKNYQPTELKLDHLKGAFQILGYGLVAAFTILCFEVLAAKVIKVVRKRRSTLVEYL